MSLASITHPGRACAELKLDAEVAVPHKDSPVSFNHMGMRSSCMAQHNDHWKVSISV